MTMFEGMNPPPSEEELRAVLGELMNPITNKSAVLCWGTPQNPNHGTTTIFWIYLSNLPKFEVPASILDPQVRFYKTNLDDIINSFAPMTHELMHKKMLEIVPCPNFTPRYHEHRYKERKIGLITEIVDTLDKKYCSFMSPAQA